MHESDGSIVSVHPFMHGLAARAATCEATRAYLERLAERDRACRSLGGLLADVPDADRVELGTLDEVAAGSIAADAARAVDDATAALDAATTSGERRTARRRLEHAREAQRIVGRAEILPADSRLGVAGDRSVGGRMFRHTKPVYRTAAGQYVSVEDAREVPVSWPLSPRRIAGRLAVCARAWSVFGTATGASSAPIRCGAPLCPRCLGAEAGARVRAWFPVVEALRAAGCTVVHLTATQPASLPGEPGATRRPVVLRDGRELARFAPGLKAGGGRLAVREGAAVPGPGLGSRIASLAGAWSQVTNTNKRGRAWWSASVVGALLGREWTSERELAPGERWLRWHVHQHALVVLRPGVSISWVRRGDRTVADARGWWADFLRFWHEHMAGADAAGQHLARVEDTGSALVEVLKYPFKPVSLTQAQAIETITATAGLHHHQVSGCWHGRSAIGRAARGEDPGRALDANEETIAGALAAGLQRRELEAAGAESVLLYRMPERGEPPRARRLFRPGPEAHDPWSDDPPERTELVPITVSWLRWAIDEGRIEVDAHEYRPGVGWAGPRSWGLGTLLNLCEESALGQH